MTTNTFILSQLDSIATQAAQRLAEMLDKATIEDYKVFLNTMYHYTSGSEQKLIHAAQHSKTDAVSAFFYEMSREEKGHHLVAKFDLRGMGFAVTEEKPEAVKRFDRFWDTLKTQSEFLGALYVFENIAQHVGRNVVALVDRLALSQETSKWLRLHAEADLEHGEEVKEMCKHFADEKSVVAAKAAQENWLDVFDTALCHQETTIIPLEKVA